ncbi:MAG: reverse transcriptase domain-containing protein, partial [Paraclostridium sp.]
MNYLLLNVKNEKIKFPIIKRVQSLAVVIPEILDIEYNEVDNIEIFFEGKVEKFKYSIYNEAYISNCKNKIGLKEQISLVKLSKISHLELLRNAIIKSGFTSFCKERYNTNTSASKITNIEQHLSFCEELIMKKNGKKKLRYFCKPSNNFKQVFKDLKNIITDTVRLEDEMFGVGKGLVETKKYFDDFEALVKIDFKDFFNQVSYAKFYNGMKKECGSFMSDELIKSIAMNVCPYSKDKKKRATYQGLPTSTICSYVAIKPLFIEIKKLLAKYDTVPVIYIDDLCFKTKNKKEAYELKEM